MSTSGRKSTPKSALSLTFSSRYPCPTSLSLIPHTIFDFVFFLFIIFFFLFHLLGACVGRPRRAREKAYISFSIIFALTAVFGSELWIYDLRTFIPVAALPEALQQLIPAELPFNVFLITTALLLPLTEYYDSFTRVFKVTGMRPASSAPLPSPACFSFIFIAFLLSIFFQPIGLETSDPISFLSRGPPMVPFPLANRQEHNYHLRPIVCCPLVVCNPKMTDRVFGGSLTSRLVRAIPGTHSSDTGRGGSHSLGLPESQPDLCHPEVDDVSLHRRHLQLSDGKVFGAPLSFPRNPLPLFDSVFPSISLLMTRR